MKSRCVWEERDTCHFLGFDSKTSEEIPIRNGNNKRIVFQALLTPNYNKQCEKSVLVVSVGWDDDYALFFFLTLIKIK